MVFADHLDTHSASLRLQRMSRKAAKHSSTSLGVLNVVFSV